MRHREEEETKKDEGGSELVYQEPSPGSSAAHGQMEVHVDDSLPASTV